MNRIVITCLALGLSGLPMDLAASTIPSIGRRFGLENIAGFSIRMDVDLDPSEKAWHRENLNAGLAELTSSVPQWAWILRRFPIWICDQAVPGAGAIWNEDERRQGVNVFHRGITGASPIWYRAMLAHELAHGFDERCLDRSTYRRIGETFQTATSAGLYRNVLDEYGQTIPRAYALTNQKEYFAELFAAWFVGNDTYPFDRGDVSAHDPHGTGLMDHLLALSLPSQHRPDLRFWRNGRYLGRGFYESLPRRQRGVSDWEDQAFVGIGNEGATDEISLDLIRMKSRDRRKLAFKVSNGRGNENITAAMIAGRARSKVFAGYDRRLHITKRRKEESVAPFVVKAASSLFRQRSDTYEVSFKK